jgi:predicted transcriptional regulator
LHLRELSRRFDVSLRAVRYHLRVMEREGAVVSERRGRFVRYFAQGSFSREERAVIAAVKVAGSRAVLQVLLERGALGFAELARATCLSNGALGWHMRALAKSALAAAPTPGAPYALLDPAAVRMALALHLQSAAETLADGALEVFGEGK